MISAVTILEEQIATYLDTNKTVLTQHIKHQGKHYTVMQTTSLKDHHIRITTPRGQVHYDSAADQNTLIGMQIAQHLE